jgi:amino acid adenylation domain-containing protein
VEEILAGIWQELLGVERVGRGDNFFELGGHSLLIVQMMERLRRVGLKAEVRSIYGSGTLAELAQSLTRSVVGEFEVPENRIPADAQVITPAMLPLVTLEASHLERITQSVPGGVPNIQDIYPLAPLQEGILFHHLVSQQGRDVYVRPLLLSLSSREKLESFIAALQQVIDRHDVLRTGILWEQLPQPVQVVQRQAQLPVEWVELAASQALKEQLQEWMSPERQRLDLRHAPLLRLQVAADPHSEQCYALLQLHHLVCDHESLEILIAELRAYLEGRAEELPAPVPYRNHVAQALAHARAHDAEAFFRSKLSDIDEPSAPFGLLDVQGDGSHIKDAQGEIAPELSQRVRVQARRLGVSSATMFHAAWGLVVARTSAREDVVFGSVLLGRLQGSAGAQRILGMFINTLPLRLQLRDVTVKELVERTQRELVELLSHEQASLAVAQRCSGISGSAPLFSTLLNYLHSATSFEENLTSSQDMNLLASEGGTNYPIVLTVDDRESTFGLYFETDRRLDPERLLGYMRQSLQSLVEALEQAPQRAALSLSILPSSERDQVIHAFNATQRAYPQEKLIHELFEEQVARTPDAVAVRYEDRTLSYAQLNARANQLARYLSKRGVGPDRLVGICVERSLEMVVGLLGILKAGGAYLPLDPNYPAERLEYMLSDAAPQVVLTQRSLREQLPERSMEIIALDDGWEAIAQESIENLDAKAIGLRSSHLAYVIYTSGSTGQPKGVMIEHANVARLFAATDEWFGFNERDVWTVFHSFAFDFSVWELWGALLYGGRLVLVPYAVARSPQQFYQLLCDEGVTVLNQTPSAFTQLIEAQAQSAEQHSLRLVIFGGEAVELHKLRPWIARNGVDQPRLVNMYGITETTVHVTYHPLTADEIAAGRHSPIGKPIPDLKTYLLDDHGQPVPIGVVGELFVGGAGIARGYLNRPELTATRFVPDPFSRDSRARLYKSGDLGRWQADGALEYLGRNDSQVKIRGFRVELGEVEARLLQHPAVRGAVVIVREDVAGDKRLVAYLTLSDREMPAIEELRAHLKSTLPEHMVPGAFVIIDKFPLTTNGKLDRRALPAPGTGAYAVNAYEPPQGETEETLAKIWQEILHVDQVGRRDNFFELGGHSLHGMKLISMVAERLVPGLSVVAAFQYPTIQEMAEAVSALREPAEPQFEEGVL